MYNVYETWRGPKDAPPDPWDARTLEWMIPSPAPAYNFSETPVVHEVDDFWHRKYSEDSDGRLVKIADGEDFIQKPLPPGVHVHMPSPSFFPLVAAAGVPIIAYGQIYRVWPVSIIGFLVLLGGIYAWGFEPSVDPEIDASEEDHGQPVPALTGGPAPASLPAAGESPALGAGAATSTAPSTDEEGGGS
jgi:cytochrome c oxidase subunit 1